MKLSSHSACVWAVLAVTAATPTSAASLEELAGQTHYHGIAFPVSGSAKLLLATHHGIFAVSESGQTTPVSPVHDYMGFAPDPAAPLTYYASGHPAGGGNSGFLKSVDGGVTWKLLSEGANGPVDFHQMDVSPADPKTIYGGFGNIQISHDGGETWSVGGAPPAGLIAIAASGAKAERIYAATKTGLDVSADAGASWQPLAFDGEIVSMVETGPDGTLLAFVPGRGLLQASENKSQDWTVLSNAFGDAVPLHLAVDPSGGNHLALTTQTNAVLESRDGGKTWVPVGATQ